MSLTITKQGQHLANLIALGACIGNLLEGSWVDCAGGEHVGYDLYNGMTQICAVAEDYQATAPGATSSNGNSTNIGQARGYTGLILGTGTTPATEDDYKMASDIYTGIVHIASFMGGWSMNQTDYKMTKMLRWVLRNYTGEEITIREIGLYRWTRYANGNAYKLLIGREVLATPIVVPHRNVFQVNVDFTIAIGAGVA